MQGDRTQSPMVSYPYGTLDFANADSVDVPQVDMNLKF